MFMVKRKLGNRFAEYVRTRAVICRNSRTGKDLAFLLSELPEGKLWKPIKVVPLPNDVEGTIFDRLKALNERECGRVLAAGQVFGV